MSQNQNIDPLQIDDLPRDPREMALRLLGMTKSELGEIDKKVISGHNYVGGTRADYNKIAKEVLTQLVPANVQPVQNTPPPQPIPTQQIPVEPVATPLVTHVSSQQLNGTSQPQLQTYTGEDPNQLQFDFYKKIKPEDLEYQLRLINSRLDSIENILKEYTIKNKKKDLAHAETAQ